MLRAIAGGTGKVRGSSGGRAGGPGGSSTAASQWSASLKGADITLSNGNLTAASGGQSGDFCLSADTRSTGKLYFEILIVAQNSTFFYIGLCKASHAYENSSIGGSTHDIMWKQSGAWSLGGGTSPPSFTTGDVLGFAYDFSTQKITSYKNGVQQGLSPASGIVEACRIGAVNTFGSSPNTCTIRTTAAEFTQSIPSGYIAWAEGS